MTLILGIICRDAIVLAADGQTTKGDAKQLGTNKISVVEFENGNALVAESGSAHLSNSAIEIFQRMARQTKIENESTISKVAENAVREVVRGITAHLNPNSPDRERQGFLFQEANYFELMVAYCYGERQRLYKLNPAWCIPVPATSYFMTSGIASDLANYILKKYTRPQMESEFASVIAVKVIQDAIDNVEGCGEPIRMALLRWPYNYTPISSPRALPGLPSYNYSKTETRIFSYEEVGIIARIVSKVESQIQKTQARKIEKILSDNTRKFIDKMMKDLTTWNK